MDTEVHEKERLVNQLQMRVAVLEQESKDKDQLMRRTKEVLEATQQQKVKAATSNECVGADCGTHQPKLLYVCLMILSHSPCLSQTTCTVLKL